VARARGKATKQGEKSVHSKNTADYLPILATQASEHFLPELKDVAFCMYILKSVKLALF
jgi:hypothetical protein